LRASFLLPDNRVTAQANVGGGAAAVVAVAADKRRDLVVRARQAGRVRKARKAPGPRTLKRLKPGNQKTATILRTAKR
jgi:hypothetical protein